MDTGRTVVVAGGGYSGVLAANRLRGKLSSKDRVLLVTKSDAMTNRVRLHERAVHGTDVSLPYTRLLARGIEHVPGRVLGLDPERAALSVDVDGETRPLHYDALVLALGSELRSRIPSASPLALALCDEHHALQLSAALPKLADGQRVIVVGGGLTAIELAAEDRRALSEAARGDARGQARRGAHAGFPAAREALLEELEQLGVQVREGVRVRALEVHAALLEDGHGSSAVWPCWPAASARRRCSASFEIALRAGRPRRGRCRSCAAAGTNDVFVAG